MSVLAFIYFLFERGIFREFSNTSNSDSQFPPFSVLVGERKRQPGSQRSENMGQHGQSQGRDMRQGLCFVLSVTPVTAHSFLREWLQGSQASASPGQPSWSFCATVSWKINHLALPSPSTFLPVPFSPLQTSESPSRTELWHTDTMVPGPPATWFFTETWPWINTETSRHSWKHKGMKKSLGPGLTWSRLKDRRRPLP